MTSVATQRVINVLDPRFYVDPWEAYRWLRDQAPVYWDPVQKLWAISRYDDVRDIGKDAVRYSSSAGSRPYVDQRDDMSMVNLDDPQHREQRRPAPAAMKASTQQRTRRRRCVSCAV